MRSGYFEYRLLDDDTAEITKYDGKEAKLEIPYVMNDHRVTAIGDRAFEWNGYITSVTIPGSVTKIGANPFRYCEKLLDITVPPNSKYLEVTDGVLFSKPDKRLVCCPNKAIFDEYSIPKGIRIIGDYAFSHCFNLELITIPDSVTTIGAEAFSDCSSLTSVTIPDSVTELGTNPFVYCENLLNINISRENKYLAVVKRVLFSKPDRRLVCYPGGLTYEEYSIPNGIRIIGGLAFSACYKVGLINIPDSVTTIGDKTFYGCGDLEDLIIPGSVTNIGEDAFKDCGDIFDEGGKKLMITLEKGSYAEDYCKQHGYEYQYPDSLDWLKD